jgi:hypothetical protein
MRHIVDDLDVGDKYYASKRRGRGRMTLSENADGRNWETTLSERAGVRGTMGLRGE